MEFKDYIFYAFTVIVSIWCLLRVNQISSLVDMYQYIKKEDPVCMQPDPNLKSIVALSILIYIAIEYPIKKKSLSWLMKDLPEKYPKGSLIREQTAEKGANHAFRLVLHSITSGILYHLLLKSDYLDTYLLGTVSNVNYFIGYPCSPIP